MIPAIGLLVGVVAGLVLQPAVPIWLQPYLPIAVVAALDAVFGGVRALLDGIFDDKVFVVSFLSNVFVAAFIVYLGDQARRRVARRPASSSCSASASSPTSRPSGGTCSGHDRRPARAARAADRRGGAGAAARGPAAGQPRHGDGGAAGGPARVRDRRAGAAGR
ncbi:hypothetical protein GCM10025868_45030 [Angustibacter aerolatus]|uniref:DUF1290 domain-containing protein n=1 Tax=Angustibacter aerolatus TaxID=1162965 RepID=A0ABQ6JPF0_9ACTN|nr:DUF1290 domain-containing protein [Angustibacter aerolatus]GMA89253.1 hypothetical protein GCM10025868_45030 [Angustibacter aerolatus]